MPITGRKGSAFGQGKSAGEDGLIPKNWTVEKCSSAQVKLIFSRFLDR